MDKYVMCASILTFNFLRFFEKALMLFNNHVFVITTCKRLIDDPQGCAHIFKDAIEPTVGADDNNCNITNERTTFSMKDFGRCSPCVSVVIVDTTKCVKSHIVFNR